MFEKLLFKRDIGFGNNDNNEDTGYSKSAGHNITPPLNLEIAIYQMVKNNGDITLKKESHMINTPELVFGLTASRVLKFWNSFVKHDRTLGILEVGDKGSGKSLECDILSNICILKGNMPVIKISGFNVDEKVIQYIQQLDNCCLYFDEFSKHVNWQNQKFLLPMLTNTNKKFLVLLTENSLSDINNFLLNRTGRVRYLVEHTKLEKETIDDYLSLFNIDESFAEDLKIRIDKALTFSFDNLMGVVSEYQDHPHESLDDILKYLNVTSIKKSIGYKLTKVITIGKDADGKLTEVENVIETAFVLDRQRLDEDSIWVSYASNKASIKINKENIESNVDGRLVVKVGIYELIFTYE